MRTKRSKASVRALSLTSLAAMTTSDKIDGMKCSEDVFGRVETMTAIAARRSRLQGGVADSEVLRRRV